VLEEEDISELTQLIANYPGMDVWDEWYLDTEDAIEHALASTDAGMEELAAQAWLLLAENPTEEEMAAQLRHLYLGTVPTPYTGTWTNWIAGLKQRFESGARPEPSSGPDDGNPAPKPRTSDFFPVHGADPVTELIRRLQPELRAFEAGSERSRWHVHGSVGRPVGEVRSRGRHGCRTSTEWFVLIFEQTLDGSELVTGYPELPLDESWRRRYPELPHLLGGMFGQDRDYLDDTVWQAEETWHATTSDEVRARVAAELSALLSDVPDDDELLVAVDALGCYVQPLCLRAWLTRVRDRAARPARRWTPEWRRLHEQAVRERRQELRGS
jgi:hypothetical protein